MQIASKLLLLQLDLNTCVLKIYLVNWHIHKLQKYKVPIIQLIFENRKLLKGNEIFYHNFFKSVVPFLLLKPFFRNQAITKTFEV